MLNPVKLIFIDSIFAKPAHDKYTQVGSEKPKMFLLNDIRWSKDLIPWHDMLLLLDDETVKLPVTKNIYSENIVISTDGTKLATSKSSMQVIRGKWKW